MSSLHYDSNLIIAFLGLVSVAIYLGSLLFLAYYLPKRFDPVFGSLVIGNWEFGRWAKGGYYGILVAVPSCYRRHMKVIHYRYGNYNFKNQVTKLEEFISIIHFISMHGLILALILDNIIKLL